MGILDRMTGAARNKIAAPELAPAAPTTTSHAARVAALAADRSRVTDASDREIARLQRQIAQARDDRERELARLEADAAAARRQAAAALTARWLDTAGPLVTAWIEEPSRLTGRALAAALADLRLRIAEELGEELAANPWALVVPFADAVLEAKPGAIDAFVSVTAASATSPIALAASAIQSLDVLPIFCDRLADLEAELQRIASTAGPVPRPENVRRWEVLRANLADWRARTDALARLNEEIEREHRAGLPQAIGNGRVV